MVFFPPPRDRADAVDISQGLVFQRWADVCVCVSEVQAHDDKNKLSVKSLPSSEHRPKPEYVGNKSRSSLDHIILITIMD